MTTAVTSAVLVTTIATVAVFFLPSLRNAILGHGQPPAALILNGSVVPGGLISIHGSNFSSGGTITITVDGHPATIASNPAGNQGSSNTQNLASFALDAYQTVSGPSSGTTVSVRSDGSFDATLRIDPAWLVGSSHLVVATEQSSGQSARLTIVVPQKPALTSCSRSTTTTTLTLGPVIEGQAQPVAAPFALCSTGSGTINWTASWNQKQAQWLQLTSSGKIQAPLVQQLPVSASAAGLKAGTYQTTVTFSSQGSSLKLVLNVTFIVRAASTTACVNTSTQALSFIATQGQGNPASQTVTIANCGDPGSWSASTNTDDGANWLSVDSNGGTLQGKATQNVPIRVTSTMLVAGTYTGQVTFKVGSGMATVNVILTVRPPAQKTCIIANPDGLGFTATQGQGDPGAQTISVGNCGSSGDWSASTSTTDGANWLSLSTAHGKLDANATSDASITVTSAGLQIGTYTGQVTFKLGSSTAIVSVFFTIQQMQQQPCLYANTESLVFTATQGLDDPNPQTLTIGNCGLDGDWLVSAANHSAWLGVDSTHGHLHTGASKYILVAARTAHLDPGEYHDRLIFTPSSSSVVVDVTLVVQPPRDCIQASTQSLDFEATSGQGSSSLEVGSIPIQTVTIGNCGPDGNWLASTAHGSTWFTLDSTHGHLNAQGSPQDTQDVKVAISITNLNPGRYHDRIAFTIRSSTALVDVNLIVQPPMTKPCIKASTGSLTFTAIQGQPDPGPQTVTLTNCGPAGYWSASSTNRSAWLNSTPFNGHLDAQGTQQGIQDVIVAVSTANATHPENNDQITFTLGSSTAVVQIKLIVLPQSTPPCIKASTDSFTFMATQRQGDPAPQTVTLTNCGPAGDWSAASANNSPWLSVVATNTHLEANATQDVTVEVSAAHLDLGQHTGQIIFTLGSAKATVNVTFTITSADCFQAVSTDLLTFTATQGQGDPAPQTVTFANGCPAGDWSAVTANNSSWLSLKPTRGHLEANAKQNVSVSVSIGKLNPGQYSDQIILTLGSVTARVNVTLTVAPATPVQQPPILKVSVSNVGSTDAKTCPLDSSNNVWTCTLTLTEDPSSQSDLNWSASTDLGGVTFNPPSGTLSPGKSAQETVTIPDSSCTKATFNFAVRGGSPVSVTWTCTQAPTQSPTQAPTQVPTQAPTQPPMLTVSPSPIDSTDTKTCVYDSSSSVWTCNITLSEDSNSPGSLNWSASTPDIAGVNFSPNGGMLSSGGSTQVGITIPASSCTSGSFNFAVQGGKTVAVPWKCTPQSPPPTQAPTQTPTQPPPPPSPTQPPAAAPIQSPLPTDTPTPTPTQSPPQQCQPGFGPPPDCPPLTPPPTQ